MSLPREQYEAALVRMRAVEGGVVEEGDYLTPDTPPYRYASLEIRCSGDDVRQVAGDMAALAAAVGGYLSLYVGPLEAPIIPRRCSVVLGVSRHLSEVEARGLVRYREVPRE